MSWDQIIATLTSAGAGAAAGNTAAATAPAAAAAATPAVAATPTISAISSAPATAGGTIGKTIGGIGSKIGETLIGQVPRTGSIPQFTGDVLQGITNPHGLLGQAMRLVGAVGSFAKSIPDGMQYLNILNAADAAERASLAEGAARGWTPEEYLERQGRPIPPGTQTSLQARNMPISANPTDPQSTPSQPNRVQTIQYPNTPEELTAARDAEMMQARSMPNFGMGVSRQEATQQAELAQRKKLPLGASEKTVLAEEAMNSIPSGQYQKTISVSEEGMRGAFTDLPPEDRAMSLETFQQVSVPPGFSKIALPNDQDPNSVYMKIVNERGESIWDIARAAANGNETAQTMLERVYPQRYEDKPTKYDFNSFIDNIQQKANRELDPGEVSEAKTLWGAGKNDVKPGESQKRLEEFLIRVGAKADPVEQQDQIEREQLYKEKQEQFLNEQQQQQAKSSSQPPSDSPFALGPTGERFAKRFSGVGENISNSLSTIPVDSPGYVAPSFSNGKKSIKISMKDLKGPDAISKLSAEVLKILTKTQSPEAAGEVLSSLLNEMSISKYEKSLITQAIVENLGLSTKTKLEIERKTFQDLEEQ